MVLPFFLFLSFSLFSSSWIFGSFLDANYFHLWCVFYGVRWGLCVMLWIEGYEFFDWRCYAGLDWRIVRSVAELLLYWDEDDESWIEEWRGLNLILGHLSGWSIVLLPLVERFKRKCQGESVWSFFVWLCQWRCDVYWIQLLKIGGGSDCVLSVVWNLCQEDWESVYSIEFLVC